MNSNQLLFYFFLLSIIYSKTPVYLNLPLDIESFVKELDDSHNTILQSLKSDGIEGLTADVFWGTVEKSPEQYDFSSILKLIDHCRKNFLKIQLSLSFHSVLENPKFSLPLWVQNVCLKNDMFYKNSKESFYPGYISSFADDVQIFPSSTTDLRTTLDLYEDFGRAFEETVFQPNKDIISLIIVGTGPDGQLKFPSARQSTTDYCVKGDFQVFDYYSRKIHDTMFLGSPIQKTCDRIRERQCGNSGITDEQCWAMDCCWDDSKQQNKCFKKSFDIEQKEQFLWWYHGVLNNHAYSIMKIFRSIFGESNLAIKIPSIHWRNFGRSAEEYSGLIVDGDFNYLDIFENAKKNNFEIIFGGIGLKEDQNCDTHAKELLENMKKLAKEVGVKFIGENPHDLSNETDFVKIIEDSENLDQLSLLRISDSKNYLENFSSKLRDLVEHLGGKIEKLRILRKRKIIFQVII